MPVLDEQKHEVFCQMVFAGKTDSEAYQIAIGSSPENADKNAWRMRDVRGVSERITELFERSAAKRVLTLAKKREILHDIATTAPGAINENNPLCQSFKKRTRTDRDGGITEEVEYDLPSKLKAIELDAKLAGELRDAATSEIRIAVFTQGDVLMIDV